MRKRYAIAVLFLFVLVPFAVSAHATMTSLIQPVGQYVIDVGYDPSSPQIGKRLLFDIALREGTETGPLVGFDSVWVRMSVDNNTFFATGIHRADFGPTTLVTMLPEIDSDTVSLSLRFEKEGETLAENSFDLAVRPSDSRSVPLETALMASTGILAILLVVLGYAHFFRSQQG